jgi:hypothetical protein
VLRVGGGNTAVEEALYLSNIASKVYLVHRRDKFKAEPILVDKLMEKVAAGKIELKTFRTLDEVLGDASRRNWHAHPQHKGRQHRRSGAQGCFIAIGHSPNTDIFQGQSGHGERLHRHAGRPEGLRHPDIACPASSLPATCRTMSTARPSPARARAAWQRWMPSVFWNKTTPEPMGEECVIIQGFAETWSGARIAGLPCGKSGYRHPFLAR